MIKKQRAPFLRIRCFTDRKLRFLEVLTKAINGDMINADCISTCIPSDLGNDMLLDRKDACLSTPRIDLITV